MPDARTDEDAAALGSLEVWDTWWRLRDALLAHPVDSLALFESLKFELGGLEEELVRAARKDRRTWQEIGDALGCSRQAARITTRLAATSRRSLPRSSARTKRRGGSPSHDRRRSGE